MSQEKKKGRLFERLEQVLVDRLVEYSESTYKMHESVLVAIHDVHTDLTHLREELKAVRAQQTFHEGMIQQHDAKIERLLKEHELLRSDHKVLSERVSAIFKRREERKNEPRGKWGEKWFVFVEILSETLREPREILEIAKWIFKAIAAVVLGALLASGKKVYHFIENHIPHSIVGPERQNK